LFLFNNAHQQAAGKTGRVVAIDADGDLKVEVEGRMWLFNPQCCALERAAVPRQSTRQQSDPNQVGNGNGGDVDDERRSECCLDIGLTK